jgi:hypothetical protein
MLFAVQVIQAGNLGVPVRPRRWSVLAPKRPWPVAETQHCTNN